MFLAQVSHCSVFVIFLDQVSRFPVFPLRVPGAGQSLSCVSSLCSWLRSVIALSSSFSWIRSVAFLCLLFVFPEQVSYCPVSSSCSWLRSDIVLCLPLVFVDHVTYCAVSSCSWLRSVNAMSPLHVPGSGRSLPCLLFMFLAQVGQCHVSSSCSWLRSAIALCLLFVFLVPVSHCPLFLSCSWIMSLIALSPLHVPGSGQSLSLLFI